MRPWPEPVRPGGARWRRLGLLLLAPLLAMAQPVFRDPPAVRPATAAPMAPRAEGAAVNLQVAWRLQADTDELAPPGVGRELTTLRALSPAGTRTTQTRREADAPDELPTLRVRNGESVQASFGQWLRREQVDWVWTAQGAGLQGGSRFDLARSTLQVQPHWPGGRAPVDLRWALSLPQAALPDAPPGLWQTEGRLSLPLDTWVRLADLRPAVAGPPAMGTAGLQGDTARLAPRAQALWVRVSRLP